MKFLSNRDCKLQYGSNPFFCLTKLIMWSRRYQTLLLCLLSFCCIAVWTQKYLVLLSLCTTSVQSNEYLAVNFFGYMWLNI